ncbi:MAG: hypothetical protein WC511_07120 [Candidatus Pacearchaeota archaeon]
MIRYCKQCKREIPKNSLDNWTYAKRVFCNKKCYSLWQKTQKISEERKLKASNTLKGRKITWIKKSGKYIKCKVCNKEFYITNSGLNRRFCSRRCSKLRENNPGWTGKLKETIRKTIESLYEYRLWHSDVLKKDNFKCQKCFSNKNIIVHHIKKVSSIIDEYNIKTIDDAINCQELWNINNGLTLCQDCHKEEHKK